MMVDCPRFPWLRRAHAPAAVLLCVAAHAAAGAGPAGTSGELEQRLFQAVVQARELGCGQSIATPGPISRNPLLDKAAQLMVQGKSLSEALQEARYIAVRATQLSLTGWRSADDLVRAAGPDICAELSRAPLVEVGVAAHPPRAVLVKAMPTRLEVEDTATLRREVLRLTNEARSSGRQCGGRMHGGVHPLMEDHRLHAAAAAHAIDLARSGGTGHLGSDGRKPAQRISSAGYRWRSVGENVASDYTTAAAVVQAWLDSPSHCANLMSPAYLHLGVGLAVNPDRRPTIVWVQKFGTPP